MKNHIFQKHSTQIIVLVSVLWLALSVVEGFLVSSLSFAAVPHLINYQGRLTDQQGVPLNGSYNLTFRIYDAETAGILLWEETQQVVIQKGIFSVLLGSTTNLNLPFDKPYFLEIKVNNEVMSPRQRITSSGYAIRAEMAEDVVSVPKGVIVLFKGASCPQGYTRVAELDGKFIAGGSIYNPQAGGSNTHTHSAGSYTAPSHTHSMPNHTHSLPTSNVSFQEASVVGYLMSDMNVYRGTFTGSGPWFNRVDSLTTSSWTGNTDAGGITTITGTSSSADSRPEFATVLFCQKD